MKSHIAIYYHNYPSEFYVISSFVLKLTNSYAHLLFLLCHGMKYM